MNIFKIFSWRRN